ncbi:hypothetical protein [Streptomyces sp. NPDC052012]|uniref:hypothetical protein n=1 Tax=Streptomyces sp. NPDC052012 TaxID=3155051 RepID=UPI003450AFC7
MTRTPRFPRRPALALTVTALAALTLTTACGTQKPSATVSGQQAREAAFATMWNKVGRSCPSRTTPPDPLPTDDPATEELEAPLPPTEGPGVDMDAYDWCARFLHEERVARALWDLPAPDPAEVRRILNDLGYPDERIHGLERSGQATRFLLDLRVDGGRLALKGSAAGERTDIEGYAAPRTGPLTAPR